jgi:hypothetical protein
MWANILLYITTYLTNSFTYLLTIALMNVTPAVFGLVDSALLGAPIMILDIDV